MILSAGPAALAPVNLTTATTVKPPFVAILNVCDPPSMYCIEFLSNVTAPFPVGPAALSKDAVAKCEREARFCSVENCARPGTKAMADVVSAGAKLPTAGRLPLRMDLNAPARHWHAAGDMLPCAEIALAMHEEHCFTSNAARIPMPSFHARTTMRT